MSNVSGVIKSIQDIMRKDVGVDGDAQRISQLVWMFFLKIYDDREAEIELLEDNYKSPLPENLRWRNWAGSIILSTKLDCCFPWGGPEFVPRGAIQRCLETFSSLKQVQAWLLKQTAA